MNRTLASILLLSVLLGAASLARGAGPPVMLTHTVTSFEPGEIITAIEMTVSIINPGDIELSDLTFTLVPVHPWFNPETTLEVKLLAARQSVELPLHLEAPPNYDTRELANRPLPFNLRYQDAQGAPHDFPVKSRPGGIK